MEMFGCDEMNTKYEANQVFGCDEMNTKYEANQVQSGPLLLVLNSLMYTKQTYFDEIQW